MRRLQFKISGGGYFTDVEINKDQYFALREFSVIDENEVFIDCGAFVGDTVEQYIWNRDGVFKKMIAFEPDAGNYKALSARVERLKKEWNITDDRLLLYPYGISEKNSEGSFVSYGDNYGLGSKFIESSDGENGCKVVALDDFVTERYTFLKADIESYEYKMLLGARKGIEKYKPLLAICIYHNAVDLYSIPRLIKSMVGEYRMAVRHHTCTLADTVLYCWCD